MHEADANRVVGLIKEEYALEAEVVLRAQDLFGVKFKKPGSMGSHLITTMQGYLFAIHDDVGPLLRWSSKLK